MIPRLRRATTVVAALTFALTGLTATAAPAASSSALLVVANPATPTLVEASMVSRLKSVGVSVAVADDSTVTLAQASAHTFTIVSRSAGAPRIATALGGLTRPLWVASPWLFGRIGLTGTNSAADFGSVTTGTASIVVPGHPMSGGRSGTVTFAASSQASGWGQPAASATIVSTVPVGTTHRAAAFTIAQGSPLAGGRAAPGCRLALPLPTSASAVNAEYWAMFDGTARFAGTGCDASAPTPLPIPDPQRLVLLISVDGLNPDAIRLLGPQGTPALHRIIAEGASTLNARTVVERTITLPNHTSMLTGRAVDAGGGHRVTFNEDNGSTTHATAGGYVASVFDVVNDAGLATAMFAGKTKFDFLDRSYDSVHGALDVTGVDDGRDKIDTYRRQPSATNTEALLVDLRAGMTGLGFVHFPDPDVAGHAAGYMSPAYLDAVRAVDGHVGQILTTVANDPGLAARTTVVLTSDHGGRGTGHFDPAVAAHYTVPFTAWGAGVAPGTDVYALNADRAEPGTTRPPYSAPRQPVRNAEAANLVTDLLGLGPIPHSWLNSDQSLDLR